MASTPVDANSLIAFGNAAAGHDGILSDTSGDLVIKPCTAAEIAFYEASGSSHPEFAQFMPNFMGTLQLGKSEQLEKTLGAVAQPDDSGQTAQNNGGLPIVLPTPDVENTTGSGEIKGKKIDTTLGIVLENITAGFVRPNILDIKLGKRLWADDAAPAKRAKLDQVASETTSGSLGFRVAGMKVWQPDDPQAERAGEKAAKRATYQDSEAVTSDDGYRVYNKLYGRGRTPDNVKDAFQILLGIKDGQLESIQGEIITDIKSQIQGMIETLRRQESRMYSSSILIVYEGDPDARSLAVSELMTREREKRQFLKESDQDDDDEEAEEVKKVLDIRLIDFAHAAWTPGRGPDENVIEGLVNICRTLEQISQS
ncbi:hypothetical protein H2203_000895 [Taxawa tesnikishii (nom. ined.)]|nr:hypothetical protein H2203_000895 [Dothideales sp. JES 119]